MLLIGFEHKLHDNKRVTNSPLRRTEHESLDWEAAVVNTIPLVYVSLLVLLYADIQLKVPEAVQGTFFFQALQPLPGVANVHNNTKTNHHHLNEL